MDFEPDKRRTASPGQALLDPCTQIGTPNEPDGEPATACCARCGHVGLETGDIAMAFWRDGGLIVIRAIPALVCPSCREEHIVDGTVLALDRMRGARFQAKAAVERIAVPVFRFVDVPGA